MDYSGNIVRDAAVRGQVPTLIVNELQSLTTDLAGMMHDCNFLTRCHFQRQRKPEWAHAIVQSSADRLYDPRSLVDDRPGACKEDCTIDYAAWCTHLPEPHARKTVPD
jgi:hypothetical protein